MIGAKLASLGTALALLLAAPSARSQTPTPTPDDPVWSLARIDLEVTVDPSARGIRVKGTAQVRLETDRSRRATFALNSRTRAMRFERLEARGRAARFSIYEGNPAVEIAQLDLPAEVRRGEMLEVTFSCRSELPASQLVVTPEAAFASWVEFWYPVPASRQRGPASPAARGVTHLRMPAGWTSVSNGSRVESSVQKHFVVETWETDQPAARSFVAAPFAAVETVTNQGRAIGFSLLRRRASARRQASALSGALSAMEKRFGPYPYPSYHVAEVPESVSFAAASEQGFIMVRSSVLDNESGALPLFAHEAAHGWWGNLVRSSGPGGRMVTEALAQYGAVVAIETLEGEERRDEFLRFSREGYNPLQCALGYFHIWREGGDKPLSKLEKGNWDHNLADSKGHWFHHMLRLRVGDDVFFQTLRSSIERYGGKEMTLDDFRAAFLTSAPGDAGLQAFLGQWLDRTGAPVVRLDWWSIERGKAAEIHVEQLQPGEPFVLPVEVRIDTAGGQKVDQTLHLTAAKQTFRVATSSRPLAVRLDPRHRILLWRPEYGPRPGNGADR